MSERAGAVEGKSLEHDPGGEFVAAGRDADREGARRLAVQLRRPARSRSTQPGEASEFDVEQAVIGQPIEVIGGGLSRNPQADAASSLPTGCADATT